MAHFVFLFHSLVYALIGLFFIIAWPISKLLDCMLGSGHGTFFRRAQLKVLVDMHGESSHNLRQDSEHETDSGEEPLTIDEVLIIKVCNNGIGHMITKKYMCLWNTMPLVATNLKKKAIIRTKVKVKFTSSLILVSLERASLVEYACQIWSLYFLWFKSYSEG